MALLSAARRATRLGLKLVIDRGGRVKVRRDLKPGDTRIGVGIRKAA